MRGSTEPRLWTPPLRELTPETSEGWDVIEFARDVLGMPLDPWQEWAVIHGLELLPDGRPRFRTVLLLAARQNGKTHLPVVLSLWWQFVCDVPLILGTSTKLDYARESWLKAVKLAERTPDLDVLRPAPRWKREANGEQESWTHAGARYKIAASNAEGGRSLTVHRLILDELRQHASYAAWGAAYNAMNAVPDAQVWALTNAGDDSSVVLNEKRDAALQFIETGEGDPRLGLLEWSAPENADPRDLRALAMANPNLGHRVDPEVLLGEAVTAMAAGGDALVSFKTEAMCIRVPSLHGAVDADRWAKCFEVGTLDGVRDRVALCLDVAPDQLHATITAAAELPDGRVRVEPVQSWEGPAAATRMGKELPALIRRIRPRALGWFPSGPAASIAARLAKRPDGQPRFPGVVVAELSGDAAAACMAFAEQVAAGGIVHADDPLQTAHVLGAERLAVGDRWVFSRKGGGHADAAYAAAGAVQLARTLPAPVGRPRVLAVTSDGTAL